MPLYEVRPDALALVRTTTFATEGVKERADLQRLLKDRLDSLGEPLLLLKDEFSGWDDSNRRIDLLCLDASANIVVVELKRGEDGGHMELQALRYAAMVSTMKIDHAAKALAERHDRTAPDIDAARQEILAFLNWDHPEQGAFARDVRIILAGAEFSKELTTTVLWLRDFKIDIRCVRLQPYRLDDGRLLLDVQPLIPLPETVDFTTRLSEKRQAERDDRIERHELRARFWEALLAKARTRTQLHANRTANSSTWIGGSINRGGFSLSYRTNENESSVELWIADDMAAFNALLAQRDAIEGEFVGELDWQDLPDRHGARIRHDIAGGYRSPPEEWPRIQDQMIDAMIRLDRVLRARLHAIRP